MGIILCTSNKKEKKLRDTVGSYFITFIEFLIKQIRKYQIVQKK